MKSPVLIGADPELFLTDNSGKFISSIGRFGGTKIKPRKLGSIKGMFVQEDNVAVEFNIAPSQDSKTFVESIHAALALIEAEAKHMQLNLAIVASATFDKDQLDNPKAKEFGCDEDMNVWTLRINPRPKAANKDLRSSGGHIHVAYQKDRIGIGRAMDLFAGVPSIMFDLDRDRRQLYGQAGCIRQKDYGIEYRTLSNFWLKSKELTELIFNQTVQAVEFIDKRMEIMKEDVHAIINCINNSDQSLVPMLKEKYGLQC